MHSADTTKFTLSFNPNSQPQRSQWSLGMWVGWIVQEGRPVYRAVYRELVYRELVHRELWFELTWIDSLAKSRRLLLLLWPTHPFHGGTGHARQIAHGPPLHVLDLLRLALSRSAASCPLSSLAEPGRRRQACWQHINGCDEHPHLVYG